MDVKTKLPVRVEKKARSKNKKWMATEWLWSDFVFDENLAPSLFSLEPLPGYTVREAEIQGFDMPQ